MYLTISKFKQVLRSPKGLDYNTELGLKYGYIYIHFTKSVYQLEVPYMYMHVHDMIGLLVLLEYNVHWNIDMHLQTFY